MTTNPDLFYRLDEKNRITEVGGGWDDAAETGGADHLSAGHVEGTNLFRYIVGQATRDFVWTMLDAVRKLKRPSVKPYRCDTPTEKRQMEMTIVPDGSHGLLLKHSVVAIEPRATVTVFKSVTSGGEKGGAIARCSICNRISTPSVSPAPHATATWIEPDLAPIAASRESPVQVIYRVCPDCSETARTMRS